MRKQPMLMQVVSFVLAFSSLLVLCNCQSQPTTATPAPTVSLTSTVIATATEPITTATPTQPQPTTTPIPPAPLTLRVGWLGAADALWPLAEQPSSADTVLSLIYDHLIYRRLDNTYAPAVAKNWSSLDDGRTWRFGLRTDVTAHDGQPFTAEDVAFTLELMRDNPQFRYYSGQLPVVEDIEATDSRTLTIAFSAPIANIEALVHWIPLLPKHVWENADISETTEPDLSMFVGTGPFILEDYQPGQLVTLKANEAYWMGAPKIDTAIFIHYAQGETLADALRDGHVDLITEVPLTRIADLKSEEMIQVLSGPRAHLRQLLLNVSEEASSSGHPALQDPQVRLAIAHAIDKQQLVDLVFLGYALPGLGTVPPVLHSWFNADIEDVQFDLAEANRILDEAGYTDSDSDGVREMPGGGPPLSLRLFIPANSLTSSQEADLVANWLRQTGMEVAMQALLPDALTAALCPTCDYDMALWEEDSGPDPAFLLSTLTSNQVGAGFNPTGYSNPAYDALYQQQSTELNLGQRRKMVRQLQELAFNDRPSVVLVYDLAVQAFRKDRFSKWLFVPNGLLSLADPRSLLQVEPAQ
jgi:peptide/nickel transport system substrate-binding protein